MKTITLELPDETASILENGGEELYLAIKHSVTNLLLETDRLQRERLVTATLALRAEAQKNGMTDEILQDILKSEH
jgi:hypothetical protein